LNFADLARPHADDDGSNHWTNSRNIILWGGQKSNMGHDLNFSQNLYVHPEVLDREYPTVTPA
jgi:hypothetical protein